jgi:plasmid stabilization system protein ParE
VLSLRILDSARNNLADIETYLTAACGEEMAVRFTGEIIAKCEHLATLPGLLGRARRELRPNIRSIPFKSYLIFFRYLPSETDRRIFEVINVMESHRDLIAYFGNDD